jgi:hypothetical protein
MPQEVTEFAGGTIGLPGGGIGQRSTGQGAWLWWARAGGEDALRGRNRPVSPTCGGR